MHPRWILEAIARGDMSLNERMELVRKAVSTKFNQGPGEYCYCSVVFDDYAIIEKGGKLWRIELAWAADGTVSIAGEAKQVRVAYPTVQEGLAVGPQRFEGQLLELLRDDERTTPVAEGESGEAPKVTGRRWDVLIIQEGMSKNRNRYSRKALQEAAPLYERAKIFLDHAEAPRRFGRSVNEQAGFLKDVRPAVLNVQEADGAAASVFALAATAVITKAAIRQEMLEAWNEGNPNLFGLSHDALTEAVTCLDAEQRPFYDVRKITAVSSVDLVSNPAAGGRVLRAVASDTPSHTLSEDGTMLKKMIEAIKASKNADLIRQLEALGAEPNEDQVLALHAKLGVREDASAAAPSTSTTATAAATSPAAQPTREATAAATATPAPAVQIPQTRQVTEAEWNAMVVDSRTQFLEASLAGCSLHDEIKKRLRKRFADQMAAGTIPTKEAITAAIKEDVDFFAALAEKQLVMPAVGTVSRVETVMDRRDKVQQAFDDFFGVVKDDKVRGGYRLMEASQHRPMSFRQLYADLTGDRDVTGRVKECTRLTEALSTSSFGEILGDSIARRMVAEYVLGSQAQWRGTIADVVPLSDFRTQRRMRFGGYGNLSTVSQGAPYPALTSPTDEEATYAAAKRGGTEQLTLEMITNDDVGAIRRLPSKMARSASQTLYEFVFDFMRTNAAIYDSTALAASRSGAVNISTTALSSTQLTTLRRLIRQQADMSSGKRLGLPARYLFVPSELEELAFQLTMSDRVVPDSNVSTTAAAAAPNFVRKLGIQAVTVDYWMDTNDYWVTSSVQDTPMIEVGFLGGREEPELFVQDQPNQGSLFSNDVITYKIRHIYGGGVLDFRGFAGGIVA